MKVGWITLIPLLCGAFYSLSAFSDLSDCIQVTVFIRSLCFLVNLAEKTALLLYTLEF